jgi:ubiquitin-protein ligase
MPPSALAIRRITLDVKKVMEVTDGGLFWIHDDDRVNHGWAVVCAYDDTPYYGGAFCFEVTFPDNYPFEPPMFNYLTNDGRTRFNPNLYKNGKVCLSLLNTWQGEPWSGVQSLLSVLQCIQTAVINQDPLVNEPGHTACTNAKHPEVEIYNRMVFHATLETAILGQLSEPPAYLVPVYDAVKAWALKAVPTLIAKARKLADTYDGRIESVNFYSMTVKYRFAELADKLVALTHVSGTC